jgi:hypothetical protein
VDQLGVTVDERGEAARLEAGPVVGDECDRPHLAGLTIGDDFEQAAAEQPFRLGEGELDGLDRVAVILGGRDYRRLVQDWQPAINKGTGAAPGRASRRPSSGQAARQETAPPPAL